MERRLQKARGQAVHVLVDDRRYAVQSIKKGGMGRVWLLDREDRAGFDTIYRNQIAVKTFDFMADQRAVERELNIWIGLSHHGIVPLLKIGRLDHQLCAIMPRLRRNLDELLLEQVTLDEQEVATRLELVAEALNYAWREFKVLHLDLKPSNFLVDGKDIKVADWGISRLGLGRMPANFPVPGGQGVAMVSDETSYSAGTPLFMAPERFSGRWVLSPQADVYSLGMIAIQLNCGILPFRFGQVDPAHEITSGTYVENAMRVLADRSERFRRFCLDCINPDPTQRIPTFRDVRKRLRSVSRKSWWAR